MENADGTADGAGDHKWSRDNFNLAPEVIADILSEVFLSGMLPLLS